MSDYAGYLSNELDAMRKAIDNAIFIYSCPPDGGCPDCRVRDDCAALFKVRMNIFSEISRRESLERIASYGEEKENRP